MTGQPKKKLQEVEEFAENCYTVSLNACCVIPKHYMNRDRRPDPGDEIGNKYRGVYELALMLFIVAERLENLLRAKAGLEPRPLSRLQEGRARSEADKGDLEEQFEQEVEQLKDGDTSMLTSKRYP